MYDLNILKLIPAEDLLYFLKNREFNGCKKCVRLKPFEDKAPIFSLT